MPVLSPPGPAPQPGLMHCPSHQARPDPAPGTALRAVLPRLFPRLQLLARGSEGPLWQEGLPQLGVGGEAAALYFQMLL